MQIGEIEIRNTKEFILLENCFSDMKNVLITHRKFENIHGSSQLQLRPAVVHCCHVCSGNATTCIQPCFYNLTFYQHFFIIQYFFNIFFIIQLFFLYHLISFFNIFSLDPL